MIKTSNFNDYGLVNNPIFATINHLFKGITLMTKGAFATVILLMCCYANAQNYRQHPLFIYSFTRYIQWPEPSSRGDFVIFVLGDSPILEELQAMAKSKKIGERSIK